MRSSTDINTAFPTLVKHREQENDLFQFYHTTEIAQRIAKLNFQWAGHLARRSSRSWEPKVMEWRPRTRSVELAWQTSDH